MRYLLLFFLLVLAGCPHDFPRFKGDGASSGDYSLGDYSLHDSAHPGCGDGVACSKRYWIRGTLLPGGTTSSSLSYTCTSSLSVNHSAGTPKSTSYELAGHVLSSR